MQKTIPSRLHTNGRAIDNSFSSDDYLFRRFNVSEPQEFWIDSNTTSAKIIPLRDDSVNRNKYCDEPEDVLYSTENDGKGPHFETWGIIRWHIDEIREVCQSINGTKRVFTMKVVHRPELLMYPHSEIIILENGVKISTNKPRSIKRGIRDHLLCKMKVIKTPKSIDQ